MSVSAVSLDQVSKSYQIKGQEPLEVLSDIRLDIAPREFLALMGPSGSGKTTLLNLISGLDKPTSGIVNVAGESIGELSSRNLAKWRSRNIGFIFQFYNLLPILTAQQNVALPLLLTNLSRKEREQNAMTTLEIVGLADRARHKPGELSGGQQQRVAIARAIVTDPTLLVCDEPTGDLDRKNAEEILNLLSILNQSRQKTIIMVTHDALAANHANQTVYLDKGRLTSELVTETHQ